MEKPARALLDWESGSRMNPLWLGKMYEAI